MLKIDPTANPIKPLEVKRFTDLGFTACDLGFRTSSKINTCAYCKLAWNALCKLNDLSNGFTRRKLLKTIVYLIESQHSAE